MSRLEHRHGSRGGRTGRPPSAAGLALAVGLGLAATELGAAAADPPPFDVVEATIADIHTALRAGRMSCRNLVREYLRRIEAYDKNGPALNAIVVVNPDAETRAGELDRHAAERGLIGPLHCVPVIVKDNFETVGLQTANGSLALAGFVSQRDAFQVRRIKEAGAIVLAKSNMAEWAFSPYETVGSILPGHTKNPYALDRVPAGSSGGTAAAVAASFGAVGLGSDTGNSIRGPSAHTALAGIRSTMGLTSRAGVVPLNLRADVAGPMARTVADAVAVFDVVVGEDPDDPATVAAGGREQSYAAALVPDGLRGARIGVLRQAYERDTTDAEVLRVFGAALEDLRVAGATVVDPALVADVDALRWPQGLGPCQGFKHDINRWLAAHAEHAPVKNLGEVVQSGRFHPSVQRRLERAQEGPEHGPGSPECAADEAFRQRLRAGVTELMDRLHLDALVYPTWSNPPRLIGDLNTPHGDNSQLFAPVTGFPAVNVPMGYTCGGRLPAGITFFGRAWSEVVLLRLAHGYEQATRHRRSPPTTPPLR